MCFPARSAACCGPPAMPGNATVSARPCHSIIEYDYSYSGIMRSFEDSLQRLGLDRIDILYMHDIGEHTHGEANRHHFPIAMREGYRAMDALRSAGAVSAYGLGVNEYQVCEKALEYGDWDCFLLAGRYTYWSRTP